MLVQARAELQVARSPQARWQAGELGWRAARMAVYAVLDVEREKPISRIKLILPWEISTFEGEHFGRKGFQAQPLTDGYTRALGLRKGDLKSERAYKKEIESAFFQVERLIRQAVQDRETLLSRKRVG